MEDEKKEGTVLKIELVQLFISVVVIVGAMFTTWVNLNSRLAIIETKQEEVNLKYVEINLALKELNAGQTKILIELQNKEDKPTTP